MKAITGKIETLRKAVATSSIRAKPETLQRMTANDLPKKDVLVVARTAGMMAAKKTPDLIPDCHPIPLDSVTVEFQVHTDTLRITASVETISKTGVEMEALTAASVAALTIYDMLKPIDKELEIVATKLVSKEGGKSDFAEHVPRDFSAAVIVTSDGTSKGTRQDRSGKLIRETLEGYGIHASYTILPDDETLIAAKLRELCGEGIRLILTTGGTGLGPRDVTVEATRSIIEREVPGIQEAARSFGQRRTPYAMLSRGLAGQKGATLIVNLPGSSRGSAETLQAIFPAILHAYGMIRGAGH